MKEELLNIINNMSDERIEYWLTFIKIMEEST